MYCSGCFQKCNVTIIDDGIGSYEYWGAMYNDVRENDVSDCCHAEYFELLSDAVDHAGVSIMEALKILKLDSKAAIAMAALLDDVDVSNGEVVESIVDLVDEVTEKTKEQLRSALKAFRQGTASSQLRGQMVQGR